MVHLYYKYLSLTFLLIFCHNEDLSSYLFKYYYFYYIICEILILIKRISNSIDKKMKNKT